MTFSYFYENLRVEKISSWEEFFYGSSKFIKNIVICNSCGYRFIDDIEPDYKRHYINQITDDNESLDHFRKKYFKKIKKRVVDKFPCYSNNSRILDIGCARGVWLDQWKGTHLFGSEYSKEHIQILQKKNIKVLGQEEISNMKFDMISLFDVLEHIEDPYSFLKELHSSLSSGGLLVVAVPDMGKFIAKIMKQDYYLVCPMHFSYFDRNSIANLFSRVFNKADISIEQSPTMDADINAISRWISIFPKAPEMFNLSIPVPYRASLIVYIKKDEKRSV